jgi:hypothetical protein
MAGSEWHTEPAASARYCRNCPCARCQARRKPHDYSAECLCEACEAMRRKHREARARAAVQVRWAATQAERADRRTAELEERAAARRRREFQRELLRPQKEAERSARRAAKHRPKKMSAEERVAVESKLGLAPRKVD